MYAIDGTSGGGTKTVTTINLCRSTFNKFVIVTPAVNIDRDCDGAGAVDTVVIEEPDGLGVSRTIAMVRDENNNRSTDYNSSPNSYSWNQWWCSSLVYTAIRCFGSSSTAGTTTKLLQPCQYRRGWVQQQRHMNNNGFYSRRAADGTYEL